MEDTHTTTEQQSDASASTPEWLVGVAMIVALGIIAGLCGYGGRDEPATRDPFSDPTPAEQLEMVCKYGTPAQRVEFACAKWGF